MRIRTTRELGISGDLEVTGNLKKSLIGDLKINGDVEVHRDF